MTMSEHIGNGYGRATMETEVDEEETGAATNWQMQSIFRSWFGQTCRCHEDDYPPWTGEIHGMSQALQSKSRALRYFWWVVLIACISLGTTTTVLVVMEYLAGKTATSTTIRLVPSLEFPAITVCPKVPDAVKLLDILDEISENVGSIQNETAIDLIRFWLGGSGLENISPIIAFNKTYVDHLGTLYKKWAAGRDPQQFFDETWEKFGYKCDELFHYCELGGKSRECCEELFRPRAVMRRGLCYTTKRNVNQTEADDIGKLVLKFKEPVSATSEHYNFSQPQMIIYVSDNYDYVLDFPRFYLYRNEWNRMHFTGRLVELLDHPEDCTNTIVGKDTPCFVRNWILSNVVDQFNCSLPYLLNVPGVPKRQTCDPSVIVRDYFNTVEVVHSGSVHSNECIPGCKRWEYTVALQQSTALEPFEGYKFNLEVSFYDLQYEHVKEVATTTVPGFMSQIGGQFGFFLGLSIITMIQIVFHFISKIVNFFISLCKSQQIHPKEEEHSHVVFESQPDGLRRRRRSEDRNNDAISSWM